MAIKTYEAFKAPSPYEQERLRAERQRRYAELLEQQAMEPEGEFTYQGIRAMPSPAAALGKLLSAYQGKKARKEAEEALEKATAADMAEVAALQKLNTPQTRSITGGTIPETDAFGTASAYQPEMAQQPMMETAMAPLAERQAAIDKAFVSGSPQARRYAELLLSRMKEPEAEEFYAPTETEGGLVQFGKRGGRKDTGVKAAPKAATPTEIARLIAERDALPPNDPRRQTYDAAIKGETQGKGTIVNIPPSARDLQQDESRLRDQLEGRLNKMDWAGTQSAMQRILSAPDTPIGDVDIVYAAAKAADSSGAVRKEDFDLRAKDGSLGGQIKSWYEEAKSGRMLPARRQQIVDSAIQFYRARETSVNKLLKDYEGIASRSGLSVQNVIEPFKPIPLWSDDDEKRLQELRKIAAQSGGKPQ
jgi:hypothetical protein